MTKDETKALKERIIKNDAEIESLKRELAESQEHIMYLSRKLAETSHPVPIQAPESPVEA